MPSETILLLGVNHKNTPLEVREKLALSGGYEDPLEALGRVDGLREYYLLSTCNRVEVLVSASAGAEVERALAGFLFGDALTPEQYEKYLYCYRNEEAIHHLFMVAASLDSMIVGESQILGQLKEAYRWSSKLKCTGPILNKLLHKSFSVAKRVRSETQIGSSAVSISYAAIELARKIFGSLENKRVLLIGAGEMAELAAEHLVGNGAKDVVVANRTLENALDLAKRFNGRAVGLDELLEQLEQVDIIVSSTGAPGVILHKEDVKPLMRNRRNKPLFFIDIAVPRDLDPALNDLDNVYLYDIDDLNNVVELNKAERDKEAIKASRIVDEEALKFKDWLAGLAITPTLAALREKGDLIVRAELERTLPRLDGLSARDRENVERMAGAIVSKLLHDPMLFLKSESCKDQSDMKVDIFRSVFGLEKKQ
ncbi:glutamyl-tRNA reductase [Desulfocapsa sulfexigens DSM 10523]|uniref:Glutamyl-tRNA reductase n=1 Tax=Desulfocapsa sulfexigens (strain DSM 10523 / SB164P1) TaxID=1167006 RepID=M1PKL4_DESSD|nr:glutamyl-tRNA reductase [Desulfocapsa sulfexigens]AGF77011.1 glutamyl-tRNA reductase [Desulfocapsa sulfexigens DSM 10523]